MLRFILLTIYLLIMHPAHAGELENALVNNNFVFLYLYSQNCGYCQQFNPIYNKMTQVHKNSYKFLKIDASTRYGYQLMMSFGARYVPYVVIINSKTNKHKKIDEYCLLKTECINNEMVKFIKK